MDIFNMDFNLPYNNNHRNFIDHLIKEVKIKCANGLLPLRLAFVETNKEGFQCELDAIHPTEQSNTKIPFILDFRQRKTARTNNMNVVMLVPTGIDCSQGGHAGDATPMARTMASVCDNLILHPNVVNASDINEQPNNALYVEGSLIGRLMMGTIGIRKSRQNRIMMITEAREDGSWVIDQVVNTVSAARATLGINCPKVVVIQKGLEVKITYTKSGRANGQIKNLGSLTNILHEKRDSYDAVAIATHILSLTDPALLHHNYFTTNLLNPWGGAEAVLTHTISSMFNVPSAHAPTLCDLKIRMDDYGQVDPRKAAEAISTSYLMCVLKGLNKAPQIVDASSIYDPSEIHAEDISALIIPDGCIGIPVIAAMTQGIKVIAVKSNTNLMKNDLSVLPWAKDQLIMVDNYFEAAGIISAIKEGVYYKSHHRPLNPTLVEYN